MHVQKSREWKREVLCSPIGFISRESLRAFLGDNFQKLYRVIKCVPSNVDQSANHDDKSRPKSDGFTHSEHRMHY